MQMHIARWLMLGVVGVLCTETAIAQMTVPGQFQVMPSGAATYSIPIQLAPGTSGMEPKLELAYSSQSGNGMVGVGWNLSGLSAVTRCPRTLAQDGVRGSVNFNMDDRYCLDGQRLIVVAGGYGENGSEYRTETDSFSRIRSYGGTGGGPQYFKVWTKSGLEMDFGATDDSRIEVQSSSHVKVWAINRILDVSRNYIVFNYYEDLPNPGFYPTVITYGAAGGAVAGYVRFDYSSERPDWIGGYHAGAKSVMALRLTAVKAYTSADALLRNYRIEYASDPLVSRVSSINLCTPDGQCLRPVGVNWQPSSSGFAGGLYQTHGGGKSNNITGDFNGDGQTDMAGYIGNGQWHMCFSQGGDANFSCLVWPGPSVDTNNVKVGDFDGDGRSDFAGLSSNGIWHVCLSRSDQFACAMWPSTSSIDAVSEAFVGDFNGDGRSDIIASTTSTAYGSWAVCMSTGSGFNCQPWQGHGGGITNNIVGDFNGDGMTDIAGYMGSNNQWHMCLAAVNNFYCNVWTGHGGGSQNNITGDFNGDGKTDIAGFMGQNGQWHLCLSKGNDFSCSVWNGVQAGVDRTVLGDFNGDGMTDMIAQTDTPGTWHTCLSTGTRFDCAMVQAHGAATANNITGDFNGDGKTDLAGLAGGSTWHFTNSAYQSTLVSGLEPGFGSISIVYRSMAKSDGTYTKTNGSLYPLVDLQPPSPVVYQVHTGGSTPSSTQYAYSGLVADMTGRGSLGFRWMSSEDIRPGSNGAKNLTGFNQAWPFTGQVDTLEGIIPGYGRSGTIRFTKNVYAQGPGSAGNAVFVRPVQTTEQRWDLNGAQMPTVETQYIHLQNPQYGDPTRIFIMPGDGSYKTVDNYYFPANTSGDRWVLGRLSATTVTLESATTPVIPVTAVSSPTLPAGADTTSQPVGGAQSGAASMQVILNLLLED